MTKRARESGRHPRWPGCRPLVGGLAVITVWLVFSPRHANPASLAETEYWEAPAPRPAGPYTAVRSLPMMDDRKMRRFPYPFKAMLSLASDCDGMTLGKFLLLHRFLNTRERTPLGSGLGLDVGDSFFFFVGTDRPGWCDREFTSWKDQMSYFRRLATNDRHDARAIAMLARAGWIDSLHSLGDFSMEDERRTLFQRTYAKIACQAMKQAGLRLTVWINHGNRSNVQNFGDPESRYQQGDVPDSPYYVTDLMRQAGIRFAWTRRDDRFGLASVLYPIRLRDGWRIWGFYRYTDDGYAPNGNLRWNWSPRRLNAQLSEAHLRELVRRHEYAVVAQHLGGDAGKWPIYGDSIAALRRLAREQAAGRILVTRTSRLLRYGQVWQYLRYTKISRPGRIVIRIEQVADPVLGSFVPAAPDLRGVTFYVNDPARTDLYIGHSRIPERMIRRDPPDETGRATIGIAWWPPDLTDHARLLQSRTPEPENQGLHSSAQAIDCQEGSG